MDDISPQQAVHRRRRQEAHLLAPVVPARQAGFARVTDDVGFDGDAVARPEVRDGRSVDGQHDAGGFVAEDVRVRDDHGSDAAVLPEVDI